MHLKGIKGKLLAMLDIDDPRHVNDCGRPPLTEMGLEPIQRTPQITRKIFRVDIRCS
jgi:hypothetical protein